MATAPARDNHLTAKGRETRRRIVEAAADLMVERGVATVSLDEVGQRTSTSKSQMYHYFANKDELVDAVVACVRDRILSFHRALLSTVASLDDLQHWADAVVTYQRHDARWLGCPLGTLASDLIDDAGAPREDVADAFLSWQQLLEDALERLRTAGHLRADSHTKDLATATLASLQGGLLLSKATHSEAPLAVALDGAIEHLRGFAP